MTDNVFEINLFMQDLQKHFIVDLKQSMKEPQLKTMIAFL